MWNYLFFMMHLEHKDRNDYTTNEQWFADSLGIQAEAEEDDEDDELFEEEEKEEEESGESKCFPINCSLSLQAAKLSTVCMHLSSILFSAE